MCGWQQPINRVCENCDGTIHPHQQATAVEEDEYMILYIHSNEEDCEGED